MTRHDKGPAMPAVDLRNALARYLSQEWARGEVEVDALQPVAGGASRLTYRVRFRGPADAQTRCAILRMIPPSGGFTSDNVAKEARIFELLADSDIPTPNTLIWSDDPSVLGAPFLLVDEVTGCESSLAALFQPPFDRVREEIGTEIWSNLGRLAGIDPIAAGLIDPADAPPDDQVWRLELAYVRDCLDKGGCMDDPLARFLLFWLEQQEPPSGRLSIVHGDWRPGNFLYDSSGRLRLVLDWELWRLGDSVFDLVYSLRSTWRGPGGAEILPEQEAIALWEKESGRRLDPRSRTWYEVAERAAGLGTLARMREEYFATGGRESLTYFFTLRSLSVTWARLRDLVGLPEPAVHRRAPASGSHGERLPEYLWLAAERWRESIAGSIDDEHLSDGAATDGLILRIIAYRMENGAQLLSDDNSEITGVLARGLDVLEPGELRDRIGELVAAPAGGLRLAELEETNHELCAALVGLFGVVAGAADPASRRIDDLIRQTISNRCERFVLPEEIFH